jgi:filamentous hemagglutinin
MELASVAIGGTVGGGSGASTALAGDEYNRQLHSAPNDPSKDEKKLIDDVLAPRYAAQQGISVQLAAQILEGAAGVMLDQNTALNSTYDPVSMMEAQSFLKSYALSQGNPTIGQDQFGQPVPLFGVSAPYQRSDSTIFGSNPQTANGPQDLGLQQVAGWSVGWMKGMVGLMNPSNVPQGLQSAVSMLSNPVAWMNQAQQGMTYVFSQAQQGNFEPAGQVEASMVGRTALQGAMGYGIWSSELAPSGLLAGAQNDVITPYGTSLSDEINALQRMSSANTSLEGSVFNSRISLKPYIVNGDINGLVSNLDVSTGDKPLGFWSGNLSAAMTNADSSGVSLLETTPGGQIANNWYYLNKKFSWANGGEKFWGSLSTKYASGASGDIFVWQAPDRAFNSNGILTWQGGYIWQNYELNTIRNLQNMGTVGNINYQLVEPTVPNAPLRWH